ncbi:MAG: hypothetical protein ACJAVZ_001597 [Afipia broomeae]|jgi:hypothetical protein
MARPANVRQNDAPLKENSRINDILWAIRAKHGSKP